MFVEGTKDVDIVLYGGAAGSGKSLGLLLDMASDRFVDNSQYGGVVFRRTYPQIRNEGGLWDESSKLYPLVGATPKESIPEWQFTSGATIRFAHLQHDKNIYDWQGAQIARIAFDELTHFTKKQFVYLLSRNRSTSGIKPQIRATTNPDAESWVAELVDWYCNAEGYPMPERSGVVRWFVNVNDEFQWADTAQELRDRFPSIEPKSFTFISAKITDNPILLSADPGYLANLQALHPIDQARLLLGNWRIKAEAGKVFNRTWFDVVEPNEVPAKMRWVRFWDMAATAAEVRADAFYTAGTLLGKKDDVYYIASCVAEQLGPTEGDDLIIKTAKQDGTKIPVRWELEGGSAGPKVEASLRKQLHGFDSKGVKPLGDKVTRAKPVALAAKNGCVKLVRGDWNNMVIDACHAFDGTKKPLTNDIVDSLSGAFTELSEREPVRSQPIGSTSQTSR